MTAEGGQLTIRQGLQDAGLDPMFADVYAPVFQGDDSEIKLGSVTTSRCPTSAVERCSWTTAEAG